MRHASPCTRSDEDAEFDVLQCCSRRVGLHKGWAATADDSDSALQRLPCMVVGGVAVETVAWSVGADPTYNVEHSQYCPRVSEVAVLKVLKAECTRLEVEWGALSLQVGDHRVEHCRAGSCMEPDRECLCVAMSSVKRY